VKEVEDKKQEDVIIFKLDISRYPKIMENLKKAAKKNFREVEMQALAYIDMGLKADDYGNHSNSH